ncbi:type VII secretion system-associated protein [Actinokineospora bangkokensis]|uniref:SseB protein N-terminal domain-containing protein n=1 Tax=Actinokineospora bangkokensis TaxID=1193682 RepID=A0A1Q9LLJ9_9PSEU|nr:type VII secretion system-associated protein [Actinokineospora bangkokensis]OLR92912.1 hypothetical protein BJP25_18225 [Actinokineospora bangkokensis]
MTRDDAVQRARAWIAEQHGELSLHVRLDDVALIGGDWYVPYDDPADPIFPTPAVEVPDDGGPLRRYAPRDPQWRTGIPADWPAPTADGVFFDPEWDHERFGHLGVPTRAVLGWLREGTTDQYRRNPDHTPGPMWLGGPLPLTPADRVLDYYGSGWLDTPQLVAGVLDVEVWLPIDHETGMRSRPGPDGDSWLPAFSSVLRCPWPVDEWRTMALREALEMVAEHPAGAVGVRVNWGDRQPAELRTSLIEKFAQYPERGPRPPVTRWPRPEGLFAEVRNAEAAGVVVREEDMVALREAKAWVAGGRSGPRPAGAQAYWDSEGGRYWDVPTRGIIGPTTPELHRWQSVVGAYVGFAIGEVFLVKHDGSLTGALLHSTDRLVREAHDWSSAVTAAGLPRRPAGWLDRWVTGGPRIAETVGLLGAVASPARALIGTFWVDGVSPVFDALLRRGAGGTAQALAASGAHPEILALRDQDEVALADQVAALGTPWEQALLITSKLAHDPGRAISAAKDPVAIMGVCALIGARFGLAGFPVPWIEAVPNRDLIECLATTAFHTFDPDLIPRPDRPLPHPGLPPVTDGMRAAARQNPGGWIYCADPDVDPRYIDGMPLPVLLGGYAVAPDGTLSGETWVNDAYKPSPRRRGLPGPQNEFEAVLNLVAAEWLPYEAALRAALDTDFLVGTAPGGGIAILQAPDGRNVLPVYSSPKYVPAGPEPQRTPLRALLPLLRDVTVVVNPGGIIGIDLPGDALLATTT